MKKTAFVTLALCAAIATKAQYTDGIFTEKPISYYWTTIIPSIQGFENGEAPTGPRLTFAIDLDADKLPTNPADYEQQWHNSPVSQGNTNTCWCYSTTSFYESEVKRISDKEVKLSEMYTVYWEYVERAKYFVQNRGEMYFGPGSETNAVARMMEMYGIVPWDDYTGLKQGQEFHSEDQMHEELHAYLLSVQEQNAWNEEEVVATTKSILNYHMGEPPTTVMVDGKEYTPLQYLNDYLGLTMSEYANFMSLMQSDYWTQAEYDVPDNWWNSEAYNNIPLDNFMNAIKGGIEKGYTISIGGDVSEVGFDKEYQVAVVPEFDVSSDNINDAARQMRFLNGATTDDHAMHLVGYQEVDGVTWFLIKDSGSGSRGCGQDCEQFGYYFFHEDYVRLKMMTITIHQDAVKDILKKMKV